MSKNLFDTVKTYLDNGLQLITIKKPTEIASLNIGVQVGAACEERSNRGISHFIEHMVFKGTINRSNEKLNSDLENLGGDYNAYTDYTATVYNTTTLKEELEDSVDLLSDLIRYPTFLEEHIEKERGVILAELRSGKDDIEDLSFQKINDMAFTHSPLKVDVIGKESIVRGINREDLVGYYNKHYAPNNTVISVVSSYEHEYVIALIKKHFDSWTKKPVNIPSIDFEQNKEKHKTTHRDNMEQSTVIYLYTFKDLTEKEELALRVLNHKFGESSNSILFRELREDRGLAYDIYTSLDLTYNLKTLYIYAAVSPEDVDATIKTINSCIERIKKEIIVFDGNTIDLMKKIFKTAIASTLEDSTDLGNYVLHQAMENEELYQFSDDMKNLNDIVAQDLYEVARKILNKPTIHVLLCDKEEN